MNLYNRNYETALKESRQVWRQHDLGAPSDNVIEMVQDRICDALYSHDARVIQFYGAAVARNEAKRLAAREHVKKRALNLLAVQSQIRERNALPVDELVDMRLRLQRVVAQVIEMPISDRLIIRRIVNKTTKSEDSNNVRRLRKILEE